MQQEPLAQNEAPQPESIAPEEVTQPETSPAQEKKPAKKLNVAAIVLGVLAFILLLGAAGLGYMAYTLNTQLTATKQELSSTQQELTALQESHEQLQSEHSSLKSDHEKMTADLNQTKTDLEQANADLTTSQDNLEKSQGQVSDLNATLDKASILAEIVYAYTNIGSQNDIVRIDSLVEKANDRQLSSSWDTFMSSPSGQTAADFLSQLIKTLRNELQ